MTVFRHIASECRTDRVLGLMVLGLSSWLALLLALLALNVVDLVSGT